MAAKMERTSTPGIYKRGNRYVITWQHRGRQHKESFRTLAEAREAKGRRSGGDRRKIPRVRLDDYAERWLATYRGRTQRGFSEETREDYGRELEQRILPFFGAWRLDDIGAQDVKEWLGELEDDGASASKIRKAKATFSALMATALEEGMVRHNPALGVRWVPREPLPAKPKPRGLTVAELERFLGVLEAQWRLLFVLLAHTGLRIGEALGLRWEHVHLGDDPHLDVREQFYRSKRRLRPKSHHGVRTLPLSPGLALALDRRRRSSEYSEPRHPVFASTTGTPLDYARVRRGVLLPAIKRSGVKWPPQTAFHVFRKTAASLLHDSGKSDRVLSDWLGHHDPAFTLRTYVGQVDDGLGDATFLDELIPVEGKAGGKTTPADAPSDSSGSQGDEAPNPLQISSVPQTAADSG